MSGRKYGVEFLGVDVSRPGGETNARVTTRVNDVTGRREVVKVGAVGPKRSGASGFVLGIDPGPAFSAYALICPDYSIVRACKLHNEDLAAHLRASLDNDGVRHVAIEGLACYGRPVGRETFETAYMVGDCRTYCYLAGVPYTIYARPEYANAIAGCGKVSDAVLYQALRLRFGGVKKGEPLHALKGESDLRSAYALACYWLDCQKRGGK